MISEESQKLINEKWPGIEDNKILLEFARQELFNYAYPTQNLSRFDYSYYLDTPEQQKLTFYKRAKFKNRFMLFAAILAVICAVVHTVFRIKWYGLGYRYVFTGSALWIVAGVVLFNIYRNKRKLITCYDELMREVATTADKHLHR